MGSIRQRFPGKEQSREGLGSVSDCIPDPSYVDSAVFYCSFRKPMDHWGRREHPGVKLTIQNKYLSNSSSQSPSLGSLLPNRLLLPITIGLPTLSMCDNTCCSAPAQDCFQPTKPAFLTLTLKLPFQTRRVRLNLLQQLPSLLTAFR